MPGLLGVRVCGADSTNPVPANARLSLPDAYARDLIGGGESLRT